MLRYFFIYKPYGMLSQFSREGEQPTLAALQYNFPKDVYPVGRLDADSEGLLLLTNDTKLNHLLLAPGFRHQRTYWVQVERMITAEACRQLSKGVIIKTGDRNYATLPCEATVMDEPSHLPARIPPIRFRKNISTSWLQLILIEGKNHQVRKMTAKVGFPTLRLVRAAIETLKLENMQPGEVRELDKKTVYYGLNIL